MSILFRSVSAFHQTLCLSSSILRPFSHKMKPIMVADKNLITARVKKTHEVEKKSIELIKESYNYGFQPDELVNSNELVKRALKLENGSPSQILAFKVSHAIKKFQQHPLDTASSGVQMAVMCERVVYMTNILSKNRNDKRLIRDLQLLLDRRKKLINYLQRTDYHTFKWVAADYNIPDELPKYAHHKTLFKSHDNRVQWSKFKGTKGEPRRR